MSEIAGYANNQFGGAVLTKTGTHNPPPECDVPVLFVLVQLTRVTARVLNRVNG
jgi:hypothetical protein